ncbi:hypothetical protein L1049_023510 [Liquidambar formosana]|uniref:Ionotropic glutamate receptor C-terminal domain-containing protein n=1 Tax=Liquidambar formosana TaxID=63359 RepID=A0AAP0RUJ8_LIQFO
MACFLVTVLFLLVISSNASATHELFGSIGGVTDCTTREGREERIAMELAAHDFHNLTGCKLVLNLRDLSGNPARAVSAEEVEVKEGNRGSAMENTTDGGYFAAARMGCSTTVVWVMVVEEEKELGFWCSTITTIKPRQTLNQFGEAYIAEVKNPVKSLTKKGKFDLPVLHLRVAGGTLHRICRFASLEFKICLESNRCDLASGAASHRTQSLVAGEKERFRRKFQSEYPDEEENPDPSVFALRAYDAVWAVAKAMERLKDQRNSKTVLSSILSSNFKGLSGNIYFIDSKLAHVPTFQMVNVVGKSYREMGFLSPKFGFSKNLLVHESGEKGINSNVSAEEVLGAVYWPGGKTLVPIGLMETNISSGREKPLQIGVPMRSNFPQFVKVSRDENQGNVDITGFSINVFQAVVNRLSYQLSYKFIPFNGSYDEMVEMVSQQTFDAAVGDVEVTADRCQLAEFSQPYVESGLVMVVPLKSYKSERPWMFMKPFTKWMWSLMAAMSLFTGFIIWSIEHGSNPDFSGRVSQQLSNILWFSFSTLYLGQRDSLSSSLSRFVLAPWLFLVLIVNASYTASLTSMLTTSRFEPSNLEIGLLQRTNAAVGLGFKQENIKSIASIDDYAETLSNGHIRAGFLLIPHAKVFIAKYCKNFTIAGPTYKLGGSGFVFPKNSSVALDISEAIQRLAESGDLQQLENAMLSSFNCSFSPTETNADQSLGPEPFAGLFILSGGASAIVSLIVVARLLKTCWRPDHDLHSSNNNG